ncbi:MAG: NrdH-redoxin [Acidimicrobiia bacterium]|nr:NrdH-redoxin [Acidimicrobiia bacterium]MDH4366505.1 NrdH-redoxin [Acidimicrobiia bacterium]
METIDAIEFYWRPGCPFCMFLERSLGAANVPMSKRNIWEDPDAAAYVRSVAYGNETVPTIRVGGWSAVNPSADEVLEAMKAEAPHLLAQG